MGHMSVDDLKTALESIGKSSRGHKDELRNRLRKARKAEKESEEKERQSSTAHRGSINDNHSSASSSSAGYKERTDDSTLYGWDEDGAGGPPSDESQLPASITNGNGTAHKPNRKPSRPFTPKYDTLLVCDVEATCELTPKVELAPGAAGERGEMITRLPSSRSESKRGGRDYPNEGE